MICAKYKDMIQRELQEARHAARRLLLESIVFPVDAVEGRRGKFSSDGGEFGHCLLCYAIWVENTACESVDV